MNKLTGFGYWRSLHESILPDPAWFVDETWSASERRQVALYLQQGRKLHYWMGFSWCRFRCGISPAATGAADLTDGTYCWPEGLSHYVSKHNLRLPEQVVRHIVAQPVFPVAQARLVPPDSELDLTWWLAQKGWHPAAKSFLSEDDQEIRDFVRCYDQGKLFFEDYTQDGLRAVIKLVQELKKTSNT